jgi:hypothetical protein
MLSSNYILYPSIFLVLFFDNQLVITDVVVKEYRAMWKVTSYKQAH